MVGNHRTIYNESLIYLSLKLNPFCKMNPLGFCILFIALSQNGKTDILVRFFFWRIAVRHLWCCVQNAHLNPGIGLAFIRLCKHAHFSITMRVDDIQGYLDLFTKMCYNKLNDK